MRQSIVLWHKPKINIMSKEFTGEPINFGEHLRTARYCNPGLG